MRSKGIYIIRHGESDCWGMNHTDYIPDLEWALTWRGVEQAKSLWVMLAKRAIVFDIMYVSPKERAQETFNVMSNTYLNQRWTPMVGWCIHTSNEIRSRSFGKWERLPKKLVLNPNNEFDYYNDPYFSAPDGESSFDVYKRAVTFFQQIIQQDWLIWVVSHSKVIECIHRYVSHLQNPWILPFSFPKYETGNTEVIKIAPQRDKNIPTFEEF